MGRKNPKYIKYIRSLPCCKTGTSEVDPHHIRDTSIIPIEFAGGTGLKPYDFMAIPVCHYVHQQDHSQNNLKDSVDISKEIIKNLVGYIERLENDIHPKTY
jgi:hypothetical protein